MTQRAMLVVCATVAALMLAACGSSPSQPSAQQRTASSRLTAAWIYVGAPGDAGWTHQHDLGRLAVQKYFGDKVKTVYKQNVPEGPQATQVINELVNSGAKIIFSTSFGYQPAVEAVMDGAWKSGFYYGSLTDGMIQIAPFGTTVSAKARAAINKRLAEIKV